jgi:hypothetical protein
LGGVSISISNVNVAEVVEVLAFSDEEAVWDFTGDLLDCDDFLLLLVWTSIGRFSAVLFVGCNAEVLWALGGYVGSPSILILTGAKLISLFERSAIAI